MSASFPASVKTFRAIENRTGVVYDKDNTKTLFAEDIEGITEEIAALETEFITPGWRPLSTIPTRQSADDPTFVLRFAADMTAILQPGDRIRITQNSSLLYLIVTVVGAYTGGNTDVTVYGGTDYDVLDTSTYPISAPKYSGEKAPFGFPVDPAKWTIEHSSTASDSKSSGIVQNTWYNLGSHSLDVPVGKWYIEYFVNLQNGGSVSNNNDLQVTLSTAKNSQSDSELSCWVGGQDAFQAFAAARRKLISLAAKATYYLNTRQTLGATTSWNLRGDYGNTIIRAVCAYL